MDRLSIKICCETQAITSNLESEKQVTEIMHFYDANVKRVEPCYSILCDISLGKFYYIKSFPRVKKGCLVIYVSEIYGRSDISMHNKVIIL